jgi:hypothetical protein
MGSPQLSREDTLTTDTYEIEAYMKSRLDGNFWAVQMDGRIVHNIVSHDFMPTFKSFSFSDFDEGKSLIKAFRIDWTKEHFRQIETMRFRGLTWPRIGGKLGSSDSAAAEFYKRQIKNQNQNMTAEVMRRRLKIAQGLLDQGWIDKRIIIQMHYDQELIEQAKKEE